MNAKSLEKYSSAITLSDMEIFIFPELVHALALANIMSPEIWKWRNDPFFTNIQQKSFTYKINRVKQYIIEHYVFNLDLNTWGLTTKEQELQRFSDFIDIATLAKSNALFGYEGDKYYFSIDIRKHFGLDKYEGNVIPYWKTETVEAMNAFARKENYRIGAGECVSLSALYIAALFIVARIPLENIYSISTPLHSQNFIIDEQDFITNNRRIVTKTMWNNGTDISAKARRALENENVTIVSHISGYIHTLYNEATINRTNYKHFVKHLTSFLADEPVITPRLPDNNKTFLDTSSLILNHNMTREEITSIIINSAKSNEVAKLSLYAARRIDLIDIGPIIKAAVERNPVSIEALQDKNLDEIKDILNNMPDTSIYAYPSIAMPDEVWNFGCGNKLEKYLLFANIIYDRTHKLPTNLQSYIDEFLHA